MDYGNAGGGDYFGFYRSFLVNDRFGETQIVSICIFGLIQISGMKIEAATLH